MTGGRKERENRSPLHGLSTPCKTSQEKKNTEDASSHDGLTGVVKRSQPDKMRLNEMRRKAPSLAELRPKGLHAGRERGFLHLKAGGRGSVLVHVDACLPPTTPAPTIQAKG